MFTHSLVTSSKRDRCSPNLLELTRLAVFNILYVLSVLSAATKADGFALYFLGESNNVSADAIYWPHCTAPCTHKLVFDFLFLHMCFSHLCISVELVFVHSNGGQGRPSEPRPLWSHRIWDDHCRSRCQDSQNATSRRHCRGKTTVSQEELHQSQLMLVLLSSLPPRVKKWKMLQERFFV